MKEKEAEKQVDTLQNKLKALEIAFKHHSNQKRKGTNVTYFVHILNVTKYLMFETDDEDVICAGILHDTLEDTSYSKEELIKDFGLNVFNLVNFCTEEGNDINKTSIELKKTWKQRKQKSIDKIKNANKEELLVYVADKLSNISDMEEDLILIKENYWSRFNASKEEIKWYYESILNESKHKLQETRIIKIFENKVNNVFG